MIQSNPIESKVTAETESYMILPPQISPRPRNQRTRKYAKVKGSSPRDCRRVIHLRQLGRNPATSPRGIFATGCVLSRVQCPRARGISVVEGFLHDGSVMARRRGRSEWSDEVIGVAERPQASKPEGAIGGIQLDARISSCGVADAGEPGGEEEPGRRAECEAHPETKRREQGVV
jgi:hypothetical protein